MSDKMLLIPRLKVQNANALSSPFTIGFPAMTAWLGAVHALQRKLNENAIAVEFEAVGVVSHNLDLQTYKGPGDFDYSIIGTANPVDKDGSRPAFIEEARCHLEVSLVIQHSNIGKQDEATLIEKLSHILNSGMKIAGGDILAFEPPTFFRDFKRLRPRLMPGYVLIERRELMQKAMEEGQDALDAILDYLVIHHRCEKQETDDQTTVSWTSARKISGQDGARGWIVPIATGFQGISELDFAQNQRDPETQHCFAEAVVTLGEFKMAYRFESVDELLWHNHYDEENSLYLCQQIRMDSEKLFLEDGF